MAPPLASPGLSHAWAGNNQLCTRSGAPFTRCSVLRRTLATVFALKCQRDAVACRATLFAPAAVQTSTSIPEESYDAEVQVLDPSAVSSHLFEQHDIAMGKLEELQGLIATMQQMSTAPEQQEPKDSVQDLEQLVAAMQQLSSAAEVELKKDSEWNGDAISAPMHKVMLRTYRDSRKAEQAKRKDERRLKQILRTAGMIKPAATQDSPSSFGTPEHQQHFEHLQQQQQLSVQHPAPVQAEQLQDRLSFAERQSVRQRRKQERGRMSTAAGDDQQQVQQHEGQTSMQPVGQQQVLLQPKKQQQVAVQPSRLRRQRSSTAAAAATAVQDSSTSVQPQRPLQPASKRGRAHRSVATAVEAAAVDAGHLLLRQPATAGATSAAVGAIVQPHSSSSSGETSVSSNTSVRQGFVPLALSRTAAPRSSSAATAAARRLRGPGVQATSGVAAAAASAVAAVPAPGSVKLSENNINGLDMRADLLSADQEKELAAMVQDLLHLENVGRELQISLGRPPSDLEWMEAAGCPAGEHDASEAVAQFQARLQHGRAAKQVMVSANYKLVVSICRKYQGYGMSLGDLINEGIAGLVKGVERFEPSKGCKFSTYAHWWIRQSVTRSLSDQGRLVRLPSHLQEMLTKMTRISRTFEAQYGREPSLHDLARELGVDASKIADAYDAVFTPRSLDQPMGDGEGATLGDVLEDERMLDAEDAAHVESLKHDMEAVLANLNAREAGVLRMRFGLVDGTERTLDEIGAQYNVTRERIRQIEAKAIRQLRARQMQPGTVIADYHSGELEGKQLASRTSSGTKKQG